ncbi:hypothetical protein JXZ92_00990 [Mycoplasma sp. CSL10137]|uniref:hypothetical protein n=1 Tax=Mycoplasma sp. CSL10137 TaxID=2813824 RepID=UPI00197BD95A|nr:hypothetical protein [Mycoplasma sp. CSL10137]MBN4083399.1 hypothetical protein [Mycoplasma sp. CSL10137]
MDKKIEINKLSKYVILFLKINQNKKYITKNEILFKFQKIYYSNIEIFCAKIFRMTRPYNISWEEIYNTLLFESFELMLKEYDDKIPFENKFWNSLKFNSLNSLGKLKSRQNIFDNYIGNHLINYQKLFNKINYLDYLDNINSNDNRHYKELLVLLYSKLNKIEKEYINNIDMPIKNKSWYSRSKQLEIINNIRIKYNNICQSI